VLLFETCGTLKFFFLFLFQYCRNSFLSRW